MTDDNFAVKLLEQQAVEKRIRGSQCAAKTGKNAEFTRSK
jgi:hypothetical protein